jgi:hypothetical protein
MKKLSAFVIAIAATISLPALAQTTVIAPQQQSSQPLQYNHAQITPTNGMAQPAGMPLNGAHSAASNNQIKTLAQRRQERMMRDQQAATKSIGNSGVKIQQIQNNGAVQNTGTNGLQNNSVIAPTTTR